MEFKYIFPLDKSIMDVMSSTAKIISIINDFYIQICNEKTPDENKLDFIGNYKKIKKNIDDIVHQTNTEINYNIGDTENLVKIYADISNKIAKIIDIFKDNKVTCEELKHYKNKIEELSGIISNNNLTDNHFVLMLRNYPKNTIIIDTETLIDCAQKWIKYNNELNEDFTEIFSEIINSKKFKELYLTAMKSPHVDTFVKLYDLEKNYKIFMDKYANKIDKYILYVPLTKGIKAYVSNYFKIALNIKSVELIGNLDEEQKTEVYRSYLLVQLLHESFHFLFRLDKKDLSCNKALSPIRQKLMQSYGEIGVDIIFHLFGTEYIIFFPLENCKLLNNLESWENKGTDFKVFDKVYLLGNQLITEGKNEISINNEKGLKCNISLYEENDNEGKVCTDSVIRYCY